jgi:threonylcarbamoyladenosine tRNA methylthiotransferase MtaB
VHNGYKEIVLTGICLGSYADLVSLIERLEKIKGLSRIRLSSIEAGDISDGLISKMAISKKLCRHLHIPVQSGDDEILKKMNRYYSRLDYLELIHKIKKNVPGIAITTDCLIGFPGETQNNFRNTVSLIQKIQPLRAHIFPYSARPGTKADNFKPRISPEIIRERASCLKDVAQACSMEYRERFLGKKMPVLWESRAKDAPGFWEGHTDNYIAVSIRSKRNLKNKLLIVKLKKISGDYVQAYFR